VNCHRHTIPVELLSLFYRCFKIYFKDQIKTNPCEAKVQFWDQLQCDYFGKHGIHADLLYFVFTDRCDQVAVIISFWLDPLTTKDKFWLYFKKYYENYIGVNDNCFGEEDFLWLAKQM